MSKESTQTNTASAQTQHPPLIDKRCKPGSQAWITRYGDVTLEEAEEQMQMKAQHPKQSSSNNKENNTVTLNKANGEKAHLPSVKKKLAGAKNQDNIDQSMSNVAKIMDRYIDTVSKEKYSSKVTTF